MHKFCFRNSQSVNTLLCSITCLVQYKEFLATDFCYKVACFSNEISQRFLINCVSLSIGCLSCRVVTWRDRVLCSVVWYGLVECVVGCVYMLYYVL